MSVLVALAFALLAAGVFGFLLLGETPEQVSPRELETTDPIEGEPLAAPAELEGEALEAYEDLRGQLESALTTQPDTELRD